MKDKINEIDKNQIENNKNTKGSFIFKNWTILLLFVLILLLFVLNMVLLFIPVMQSLIESAFRTSSNGGGSGFFIILIPIITLMKIIPYIIPQFIGIILTIINIILTIINFKKKNVALTLSIFISSLFSLLIIIFSSVLKISGLMLNLYIIETTILSIITLLKSVFEIKKWKTNKITLATYTTCLMLLIFYVLFYSLSLRGTTFNIKLGYSILLIIPLMALRICFIIFAIFGIINLVRVKEKVIRKKVILMFVILISLLVSFQFIPVGMKKLSTNIYKNQTIQDIIEPLVYHIKKDKNNRYVYLMNDLEELAGKELSEYSDASYITNFDDEIYVCLYSDEYVIEGNEKNYEIKGLLTKPTSYQFDTSNKEDGEKYLKYYLQEKYDLKIINVTADVKSESKFDFKGYVDHYDVETTRGNFEAMVEVVNNEIVVTDEISSINLNDSPDIVLEITEFTKSYLGVEELSAKTIISDVSRTSPEDEIITIRTGYDYDEAMEYANSLGNYLTEEDTQNAKIAIVRYMRDENGAIDQEYAIYITIEEGRMVIE